MSQPAHRVRGASVPVLLALLVAAVATVGSVRAAPRADAFDMPAFYEVPATLPDGGPGTIIRSETVAAPDIAGTVERVMYKSRSIAGDDIAVTGYVVTPEGPAPAGGFKVVAWAHGTTGMADQCAPSLNPLDDTALINVLLAQGWAVAATDYEGLGTPGLHPYIVGESEARGVLDSVRALRNLDPDVSADFVVWGHSQGGHAALFTQHFAQSWAPELHLDGAVAGAPPSQLGLVYDFLVSSPYRYYLLMVAGAINAAYGDTAAPLGEVMNADGIAKLPLLDEGCGGFLYEQTGDLAVQSLMVQQADGTYNPFSNPVWGPLIAKQDAANFTAGAPSPLLLIHGGADEQIPTVSSQILAGQMCSVGQDVERWMYPGQSHSGVIATSIGDMVTWIGNRFDGLPTPDTDRPTGMDDIDDSVCVDGVMASRAVTAEPTTPTSPVAAPVTTQPTYTG